MRALSSDPLRNFKFGVTIIPAGDSAGMSPNLGLISFMTVSGLGVQNEVIPYREGGNNTTALPLTSHVLTTTGWKLMGDIQVGDRVIDPRGEDSKVVGVYPAGVKDVYRVTLGDGSSAVACHGHLWEYVERARDGKKSTVIGSTLDMKKAHDRSYSQVTLPKMSAPAEFESLDELPLDPYLMGLLLSEGSLEMDGVSFAQEEANTEIIERARQALPPGHTLRPKYQDGVLRSWHITVGNDGPGARNVVGRNKVIGAVRDLGLLGHRAWEKFIPEVYKWASVEDRLALLQGIMDGDGWVDTRHSVGFSSSSENLTCDVIELITSLGGRCGRLKHTTDRKYRYKGKVRDCRDSYEFSGISDLAAVPFTLPRKVERYRLSAKTSTQFRHVRSIEFVGREEVQCIEVSAESHLFISDDYIISHNTRKMPGQSDFGPITLGRGMMAAPLGTNGVGTNEIYNWLSEVFSVLEGGGTNDGTSDFRADVMVDVYQHPITAPGSSFAGGTGASWKPPIRARHHIYNAWPMALSWSDLDAGGNAIIIETLQLAHEGFHTVYAPNGAGQETQYLSTSQQ